mmetsp:Transcript_90455/g.160204  ORF Transcript_90455/g.160204 Transcript_90455/m.160204 type:complete len:216 (+) Transcript_90455:680-1327(+)
MSSSARSSVLWSTSGASLELELAESAEYRKPFDVAPLLVVWYVSTPPKCTNCLLALLEGIEQRSTWEAASAVLKAVARRSARSSVDSSTGMAEVAGTAGGDWPDGAAATRATLARSSARSSVCGLASATSTMLLIWSKDVCRRAASSTSVKTAALAEFAWNCECGTSAKLVFCDVVSLAAALRRSVRSSVVGCISLRYAGSVDCTTTFFDAFATP